MNVGDRVFIEVMDANGEVTGDRIGTVMEINENNGVAVQFADFETVYYGMNFVYVLS